MGNCEHKLLYINSRSLLANFDCVEIMCSEEKPFILACSESRITREININEYKIDGYNAIECFSATRFTGGVVIYVRADIKYKLLHNDEWDSHLWFVTIELFEFNCEGLYHVFYRSPDKKFTVPNIVKIIDKYLNSVINLNKQNIMVGDLNVDMNSKTNSKKQIDTLLTKHGLFLLNDFPTRITTTTQLKLM